MIVLGIDPGYALMGWGVVEAQGARMRLLGYGCVETQAGLSSYFILNCSFAAPHWQCVIAHAIASAASSGFGISFIPSSSFTIC